MKKFIIPDLDSETHENMINIFNKMLKIHDIKYKVVISDDEEHLELREIKSKENGKRRN